MPLATGAKHVALNALRSASAPAFQITHVGLLTKSANKNLTTPFGVNATDVLTSTAHGLSVNDLVVFTSITGGLGIIVGHPYFVKTVPDANTFTLSPTIGGTLFDFTTDPTAGVFVKLTEVSGGSPAYARKPVTLAAAALETIDDTGGPWVIDVPASTIDYVALASHVSTAFTTVDILMGIQPVTQEVFAAQGTYSVTDLKVSLVD